MMRKRRRNGNGNGHKGAAPRWLQILLALAGLGVVMVAGAGITGFGVYRSYANDFRPPDEVIAEQPSGGAQIFDRNGNLLYEFVDDKSGLRSPVKLEDISPWLIAATISTEDFSYWDNPGVNYKGLARAGLEYANLREADASQNTGGSSITQQLVKNVYISAEDRSERSVRRKMKETVYAIEMTRKYDKNQILEWYLNQISYGGIYNGVEAAAQGYFGKSAKDLNLPEAALLAGIPAYPSEYEPRQNPQAAQDRRNSVLRLMASRARTNAVVDGVEQPVVQIQVNDDGTTVDLNNAMFYLSTLTPVATVPARFPVQAPHFVFDVIQEELVRRFGQEQLYGGGLRVTTTLDLDMQTIAQESLETWISEFEASASGHNGALVAIDPETSELLVMVGSRDYFRDDIEGRNNNATADNSPGSTLKPFAYAAAFEQLNWGTETEILDTPISFPDGDEPFVPRNPSGNFQGPLSVRKALGNSLNIPAVKTAAYVGVANVAAEYKKFGITGIEDQQLGPALVVGGIDINLFDVTYAYTVFANNGVMRGVPTTQDLPPGNRELDPVTILQVVRERDGEILYPEEDDHRVKVQERRVIDARYAWMVNDILSDPNAFCITYGCGSLSIGREWGVKTGTSEPYENSRAIGETWTYGYTPDLVAGVWAGNSDNSPMYNITSTSISYRALRDFMVAALKDVPAREFEKPPGLKEVETCTPSGLKSSEKSPCPRKVKQLLPDTLKLADDDWFKRVKVDIRDGLLATELTPPQFVAERFGLNIPESVEGFARTQAQEWSRFVGAGRTPTDKSTGDAPVRIDSPRSGSFLKNNVRISGKADSEHFVAYRLEWGVGTEPTEWNLLVFDDEPESGGDLAEWDVRDLADGAYKIRLVLLDEESGELTVFVNVNIGENIRTSGTPVPTPTPSFQFGDDDD